METVSGWSVSREVLNKTGVDEQRTNIKRLTVKYGRATRSVQTKKKTLKAQASTYEVKPSTHMFFQMFLLFKNSSKKRQWLEEGASSEFSSANSKQGLMLSLCCYRSF